MFVFNLFFIAFNVLVDVFKPHENEVLEFTYSTFFSVDSSIKFKAFSKFIIEYISRMDMNDILRTGLQEDTVKVIVSKLTSFDNDFNMKECENTMFILGQIMEKYGGDELSKSRAFVDAITNLLLDRVDEHRSITRSNLCFERTLFVFIELISSSSSLVNFQKNISDVNLYDLFRHLSLHILIDGSRDTQDSSLGILGRLFYAFKKRRDIRATKLKACICKQLADIFSDDMTLLNILNNPRLFLNSINQSNPKINSVAMESVTISDEKNTGDNKKIPGVWLDLCQDCVMIEYLNEDQITRMVLPFRHISDISVEQQTQLLISVGEHETNPHSQMLITLKNPEDIRVCESHVSKFYNREYAETSLKFAALSTKHLNRGNEAPSVKTTELDSDEVATSTNDNNKQSTATPELGKNLRKNYKKSLNKTDPKATSSAVVIPSAHKVPLNDVKENDERPSPPKDYSRKQRNPPLPTSRQSAFTKPKPLPQRSGVNSNTVKKFEQECKEKDDDVPSPLHPDSTLKMRVRDKAVPTPGLISSKPPRHDHSNIAMNPHQVSNIAPIDDSIQGNDTSAAVATSGVSQVARMKSTKLDIVQKPTKDSIGNAHTDHQKAPTKTSKQHITPAVVQNPTASKRNAGENPYTRVSTTRQLTPSPIESFHTYSSTPSPVMGGLTRDSQLYQDTNSEYQASQIVEDSRDSDDDGPMRLLLQNLVSMNEARAKVKAHRRMNVLADEAMNQANSFLESWKADAIPLFVSCIDVEPDMVSALEKTVASIQSEVEAIQSGIDISRQLKDNVTAELSRYMNELLGFKVTAEAEINNLHAESTRIKRNVSELKRKYLRDIQHELGASTSSKKSAR